MKPKLAVRLHSHFETTTKAIAMVMSRLKGLESIALAVSRPQEVKMLKGFLCHGYLWVKTGPVGFYSLQPSFFIFSLRLACFCIKHHYEQLSCFTLSVVWTRKG